MPRRPLRKLPVLLVLVGLCGAGPGCRQSGQTAQIKVLLPEEQSSFPTALTLNGQPTTEQGTERLLSTPPLEAGKDHVFTVKAIIKPNNYTTITRTRQVTVQPGKSVTVDLRQEDAGHKDDIVVLFVATPEEVVDAMIKLGEMTKDDVVYDIGCGDGRMVIAAVKQGAKRGVGIDIDPQRIAESKENARKAGVEDKVEFRVADALKLEDLPDATLVLLYMGQEMNKRLEPILKAHLKPGARVVSHRFLMGNDWPPHKTISVRAKHKSGEEDDFEIHLWKIGAGGKKD